MAKTAMITCLGKAHLNEIAARRCNGTLCLNLASINEWQREVVIMVVPVQ